MRGVLERLLGAPVAKAQRTGTHRSVPLADTVARVRPLLPLAGITRIANVTGLDYVGLPVVQVIRPNSRSLAVSQGKGLTLDAAIASGVMESLELHHAETIDRPLRLGSHAALRRRHRLVAPERLPATTGSRYGEQLPILWLEGEDLVSGESAWVPHELVDLDAASAGRPGAGCFVVSSNGLASGNTMAEAVAHALFELVERDATTLWNQADAGLRAATRIDLGTVTDPDCRAAIARCEQAGLVVIAWEQTQDVALPAFECMLAEPAARAERSIYTSTGMGCHACREVAFLRALTEAAQSRLTLIAGARDDVFESDYEIEERAAREIADLVRESTAAQGPRRFTDAPTFDGETTHDDVRHALACLAGAGLDEVVMVDLAQPELGLPVVRLVVPGLEGCDKVPGYVPGERARRAVEAVA